MLNFKNSSQQLNWQAILNNDDANESYELFQSTFISSFNQHFPLQTKNISSKNGRKPRITLGILTHTNQHLERKARNRPDQFFNFYRRYRTLQNKNRKQYYRNLLESSFGNS